MLLRGNVFVFNVTYQTPVMNDKFLISHDHLIKLAGKAAFNRGMNYFKAGNVLSIRQKANKVTAEVDGSEIYRVTLKWTQAQFDGACDCPASEGFDFCKHCVAVALTLQQAQLEQEKLVQGGTENRIKAYLLKQDREKLADWLLKLIESESILLQEWSMRADNDLGVLDTKAIKKRITAAIPYNRNLHRYNQVRNYFVQVELMADQLQDMAEQLPADELLKLVDYALQRIDRALETIDDSGGFRYAAIEVLQITHINACNQLEWTKKKITNYLLDLAFGEYQDLYPAIPSDYIEALGENGIKLFYQEIQARWQKLPPLKEGATYEKKDAYFQLQYMLEEQARQADDDNAIILLRQKTATDLHGYQDLAERCLNVADYKATEKWLKKCRKISKNEYHSSTERIQIKLLITLELWTNALEQQWIYYTHSSQLNDYLAILKTSEKADDRSDWRKKAEQFLKQKAQAKTSKPWSHLWLDRLVEFYLHHEAYEKALAAAEKEKIDLNLLLKLAWRISDKPEKAFPLFQQVLESQIGLTNNNAYHQAIGILKDMVDKIKTKQQKQHMSELLTYLRQKFRAKRNFIKWLDEAFDQ